MKIKSLPFIASRDGKALPKPVGDQLPRCFWNVKPTGDFYEDTELGTRFALAYLRFEEESRGAGILNMIVGDMPRPLGQVEHTFLQLVCFQAKVGAGGAQRLVSHWSECRAEEPAGENAPHPARRQT